MTPSIVSHGRRDTIGRHTWKKPSLGHSKHEAGCQQTLIVGDKAHQCHDATPGYDDGGEEYSRRKFLEQSIRDGLEERIGDEKDGERDVVLGA